ncbi:hypothetical protein KFL_002490150 [Klebsormidium nitens]|uniref:Uncharacterized protein n=1 Tax=Klebsormidium nitens TaxID=105231 RepID=A0A1Y1IAF2_KLENI|nr:hypothetical protein KFL_002490150 [Klebsormidium nitens]|eukprot:GAQ85697.1 hypothetical protein KFL_002490150 [Klebsormidium nitens]
MEASAQLFVRSDGKRMCFFLPPSVRDKDGVVRKQVKELVENYGGRFRTPSLRLPQDDVVIQLVHVGDAGNEKALQAAKARGEKLYFCTYVLDSVKKGILLKSEDYEVHPPPPSAGPKRTYHHWTREEDKAILEYASKSILARRGDIFWQEAERQKVTPHSWQAMKERYNKYLAPAQKPKANAPPAGHPPTDLALRAGSSQPHLPITPSANEHAVTPGPAVEKQTAGSAKQSQKAGSEGPKQREREQEVQAVNSAATPGARVPEPSRGGPKNGLTDAGQKQREAGQEAVPVHGPSVNETAPRKPQGKQPSAKAVPELAQQNQTPLQATSHPKPGQKAPLLYTSQADKLQKQPLGKSERAPAQIPPKPLQKVPPPGANQPAEHPQKAPEPSPVPTARPLPPKTSQPAQLLTSSHGAAVLRAPPKAALLKPVPVQILGAAAAVRERAHRDEVGAGQAPTVPREAPFTQAPDLEFTVPETPPETWDGSQREEEALGKPAEFEMNEGDQQRVAAVERREGSGGLEEARARERKRARDDVGAGAAAAPGVVGGAKKQRIEAQKPSAKGVLPGSPREELWFDVLPPVKEQERHADGGDGAQAGVGPSNAAPEANSRLPAVTAKGPSDDRHRGRGADLGGSIEMGEAGQHQREPDGEVGPAEKSGTVGGENAETGRVAEIRGEGGRGEDRASQGLTKQLEETKRRRLRKANGELVGEAKRRGAEPPPARPSDVPPERVAVIRSWVADFVKQYGCSQDDIIAKVIEASGDFEAARPLLDPRSRSAAKGPVWSLREDHVLLTQPVDERDVHPEYVNLREVFGSTAVESRLTFLGRL